MHILEMRKLRLSLKPALKLYCTAAEWAAGRASHPLFLRPLAFMGKPTPGPAPLTATFLPRSPAGGFSGGLRQRLRTALEKPKRHFHLIINMCQRGRNPSDLGLRGHWTVKSLWQNPFVLREAESKSQTIRTPGMTSPVGLLFLMGGNGSLVLKRIPARPGPAASTLRSSIHFLKSQRQPQTGFSGLSDTRNWWPHQHSIIQPRPH